MPRNATTTEMLLMLEGIDAVEARGMMRLLEVMAEEGVVALDDLPRWAWAIRAIVADVPGTLH